MKKLNISIAHLSHRVTLASLVAVSGLVGVINCAPKASAGLCQSISIPAYFYPGTYWQKATEAAPRVGVMIMNPNSGPGSAKNTDYVIAVKNAQAGGIKVIGYVPTTYGTRSATAVKIEIDQYKAWYAVDGIFLDEVVTSTNNLAYYTNITNYIRNTKGTLVMLNPGTAPAEDYIKLADITVVFEDTYSNYQNWQAPAWLFNYPANKFAHLIHTTSGTTGMNNAIELALVRNAGTIYVTDDVLPNPWDTLPTYWTNELTAMTTKCST
ncbi:Energy-coupling factor transporter ATP-binding protein EcfA2 (plasmid) [Nostoc flagelliforme CCNUN1]|uniref:Energy-coupling factor transporter ATP-binding protein EcfA2 n=1 Tax=Nostoc flagelliforme CCNUN1 TaxID=2038116 RepID=A0A2K8TBD6_9NOSO|nr:spherulation-specific family 4 protein [Nostoc flagelliforme]AUB44903.1 Energy-coupling factor transporter ATP-binding protein EcfA2 [Nostoc flagelliforme CCNUN1]